MASREHSSSVDPLVPLSLLEAVREADRPEDAEETEYAPELLNKRLGITDTVYAQIRRYSEAVHRGRPVDGDEVTALARLIARRPDAFEVFRAAGIATARSAYDRLSSFKKAMLRRLPRFLARPLARRQARRIIGRYFGAALQRAGQVLHMDVPPRAPVAAGGEGPARAYYDAALLELLSLLMLT
ncbi:MAG: hypothetical protein ACR2M1_04345 [Gemmatimonadaceae bacterium]